MATSDRPCWHTATRLLAMWIGRYGAACHTKRQARATLTTKRPVPLRVGGGFTGLGPRAAVASGARRQEGHVVERLHVALLPRDLAPGCAPQPLDLARRVGVGEAAV